jgi:hypothetical protein
MGKYHALFYRVFGTAGILFFGLLLILGIPGVVVPLPGWILPVAAQLPGLVLFSLLVLLISAVIVYSVKKLRAFFSRDSGKTRDG